MGRRTSHRACVMGDTRSGHDRIHRELRWRASQLGRRYKCPIARSSRRCGLQSLLSLVGRLASLRLSRLILSSIFAPVHRQPNHRVGLILSYLSFNHQSHTLLVCSPSQQIIDLLDQVRFVVFFFCFWFRRRGPILQPHIQLFPPVSFL